MASSKKDMPMSATPTPGGLQARLRKMFDTAQLDVESHQNLIKHLLKLYSKIKPREKELFAKEFCLLIRPALIIYDSSKEVDNFLSFVAAFAVKCTTDNENEEERSMLTFLIAFLQRIHDCDVRAIRYRCCQLLSLVLNEVCEVEESGIGVELDVDGAVLPLLEARSLDKDKKVRLEVVKSLHFTVDRDEHGSDEDLSYKMMVHMMNSDTLEGVRLEALKLLPICKKSVGRVIDKVRDIDVSVRTEAFSRLASKVSIKTLGIERRHFILNAGLNDTEESIRKDCEKILLGEWLNSCASEAADENKVSVILVLLKKLNIYAFAIDHEITASRAIFALFLRCDLDELIDQFEPYLDSSKCPSVTTAELTFCWYKLVEYTHGRKELPDAMRLEYLDRILPNILSLSKYIEKNLADAEESSSILNENEEVRGFILKNLMMIFPFADSGDSFSRTTWMSCLDNLIQNIAISGNLLDSLVEQYVQVFFSDNQQIIVERLCEIVQAMSRADDESMEVSNQDSSLQTAQMGENLISTSIFKNEDDSVFIRALTITYALLKMPDIDKMTAPLYGLLDSLIIPSIKKPNPSIRSLAFKALSCCCLLNFDTLKMHISLFIRNLDMDVESVQQVAISGLFDMLMLYGFEPVCREINMTNIRRSGLNSANLKRQKSSNCDQETAAQKNNVEEESYDADNWKTVKIDLIETLLRILKKNKMPLMSSTIATGLCRLLATGRLYSAEVVSRLVLVWFNTEYSQNTDLLNAVGLLFELFPVESRNQEMIVECFIQTLKVLDSAPPHHPLSKIPQELVAKFLVQISSSCKTKTLGKDKKSNAHGLLAVKILNEMKTNVYQEPMCRLLSKVLNSLEISTKYQDRSELQDLLQLTTDLLDDLEDLKSKKQLQVFHGILKNQLQIEELQPLNENDTEHSNTDSDASANSEGRHSNTDDIFQSS